MIALTASKVSRILSFRLIERFVYERYGVYFEGKPSVLGNISGGPHGNVTIMVSDKAEEVDAVVTATCDLLSVAIHLTIPHERVRVNPSERPHTAERLWWLHVFRSLYWDPYVCSRRGLRPRVKVTYDYQAEEEGDDYYPHPLTVALSLPEKMILAWGEYRIGRGRISQLGNRKYETTALSKLPAGVKTTERHYARAYRE